MKKFIVAIGAAALVVGLSVGVAFAKSDKAAADAAACVLLPDTKSSVRWETQDRPTFIARLQEGRHHATDRERRGRRPEAALAGRPVPRERCQGDPARRASTPARVRDHPDAATAQGVKTIDYDRLDAGGKGANYYVSFDNPTVGKLMGEGVGRVT